MRRSVSSFRLWVASALTIALALTMFTLLVDILEDRLGDFTIPPRTWHRDEGRYLLWPALALGRLGLSYTIFFLPLVLFGLVWVIRFVFRRSERLSVRSSASILLVVLYGLAGWCYISVLPVPRPVLGLNTEPGRHWAEVSFLRCYRTGYSHGMIDMFFIQDGISRSCGRGYHTGFAFGVCEWERLFPPLTRSLFRQNRTRFEEQSEASTSSCSEGFSRPPGF